MVVSCGVATPWLMVRQADRTLFRFTGRLTTAEGVASAQAFARVLAAGPTCVTWDVRAMQGYETGARVAWQRVLWPYRHNITSVLVLGGGPFVRLGAITLATALDVPLTFRDEGPEAGDEPTGR